MKTLKVGSNSRLLLYISKISIYKIQSSAYEIYSTPTFQNPTPTFENRRPTIINCWFTITSKQPTGKPHIITIFQTQKKYASKSKNQNQKQRLIPKCSNLFNQYNKRKAPYKHTITTQKIHQSIGTKRLLHKQ